MSSLFVPITMTELIIGATGTTGEVIFEAAAEKGEKGKKHHKGAKDPNDPNNKPAEPNKATVISLSDFGTYTDKADANKPCDANKPTEKKTTKMCAVEAAEKSKGCDKDPNKPADSNDKK